MRHFLRRSTSCNPLLIAIFFLFLTFCYTSPAHIPSASAKNHNDNHETSSLLSSPPPQQEATPSTSLIPYENSSLLLHPRQIPPPATTITVYNPLLIFPFTPVAAATIRFLYAFALAILREPGFWSTFTWGSLIGFTLGQIHLSINATRRSSSSPPPAKNVPKVKNKRAAAAATGVKSRERTPSEPSNDDDDIDAVSAAVRDVIGKLALLAARGFVAFAQVAITVGKLQIAVAVLTRAVDPPWRGGRVIALPNLIT